MITPVGKVGRGCQEVQREGPLSAMHGSPYSLCHLLFPRPQRMGICHGPKNWSLVCGLSMSSVGSELYFLCDSEYRYSTNL